MAETETQKPEPAAVKAEPKPEKVDILEPVKKMVELTPKKKHQISLAIAEAFQKSTRLVLLSAENNLAVGGPVAKDIDKRAKALLVSSATQREIARQRMIGAALDKMIDERDAVEEEIKRQLELFGKLAITLVQVALV